MHATYALVLPSRGFSALSRATVPRRWLNHCSYKRLSFICNPVCSMPQFVYRPTTASVRNVGLCLSNLRANRRRAAKQKWCNRTTVLRDSTLWPLLSNNISAGLNSSCLLGYSEYKICTHFCVMSLHFLHSPINIEKYVYIFNTLYAVYLSTVKKHVSAIRTYKNIVQCFRRDEWHLNATSYINKFRLKTPSCH